jgi:hypothetical protein
VAFKCRNVEIRTSLFFVCNFVFVTTGETVRVCGCVFSVYVDVQLFSSSQIIFLPFLFVGMVGVRCCFQPIYVRCIRNVNLQGIRHTRLRERSESVE